jgi:predicted dehydrogenase
MMQEEICVGIVGANANNGWAKVSHVAAINGLPGLKLAAVATRNEQSARETAEAFGAERWFSDPFAMVKDERIDVITVCVKVPAHRHFVLAALDAGKAVYCESPLGPIWFAICVRAPTIHSALNTPFAMPVSWMR